MKLAKDPMATNLSDSNGTVFSSRDTLTTVSVLVAYALVFPAALLGNTVVIHLIVRNAGMRTVTNYLIVNMSVANLLVAFVAMPYSVFLLFVKEWLPGTLGTVTCRAVHFSYAISIAASIFSLLLSSLDRYYAVMRPLNRKRFLKRVPLTTALIWISSAVAMSPYLVQFKVISKQGEPFCILEWSQYGIDTIVASRIYFLFVFVFLYTLPLLVIAVTFFLIGRKLWLRRIPGHQTDANLRAIERSKRKVVRMFIIVISAFAFSWIPAHVMHFMIYWNPVRYLATPRLVALGSFWFCHLYSAISPFLFLGLNEKFRAGFRGLFGCRSAVSRRRDTHSTSSRCDEDPRKPMLMKRCRKDEQHKVCIETTSDSPL